MSDDEKSTKTTGPNGTDDALPRTPAGGTSSEAAEDASLQEARRLFLRAGIFAPAVLASLAISQDALAQSQPSCAPRGCPPAVEPCAPPCMPQGPSR
jgi:hypothetical protein